LLTGAGKRVAIDEKKLARQEHKSAQKVQELKQKDTVLKDMRQELEKKDILLTQQSKELEEKTRQLAANDARLTQVLNSKSFRLGRFIMSPFFLIRGIVPKGKTYRSQKEH
jgi:uncharacterized protein (DUF3084 family)